ncbi:hypothetical protein KCV06_g476, partial [Aureobasidium melanogenum]
LSRSHLTVVCPILNLWLPIVKNITQHPLQQQESVPSRHSGTCDTSVSSNSLSFLLSPVVNMEDLRAVKWHVSDSLTRIDDEEV